MPAKQVATPGIYRNFKQRLACIEISEANACEAGSSARPSKRVSLYAFVAAVRVRSGSTQIESDLDLSRFFLQGAMYVWVLC